MKWMNYIDTIDESPLNLIGNRSSKIFDLINSPQNLQNIQNIKNKL